MRAQRPSVMAIMLLAVMAIAQQPGNRVPQKIRISWDVAKGILLHKVEPQLPLTPDGRPLQGRVVLRINIDKRGNVAQAVRLDGTPELADATIAAVKQWTFKPFLLNGDPLEAETEVKLTLKPGHPARTASPD